MEPHEKESGEGGSNYEIYASTFPRYAQATAKETSNCNPLIKACCLKAL
jgi:hypothetical protein